MHFSLRSQALRPNNYEEISDHIRIWEEDPTLIACTNDSELFIGSRKNPNIDPLFPYSLSYRLLRAVKGSRLKIKTASGIVSSAGNTATHPFARLSQLSAQGLETIFVALPELQQQDAGVESFCQHAVAKVLFGSIEGTLTDEVPSAVKTYLESSSDIPASMATLLDQAALLG